MRQHAGGQLWWLAASLTFASLIGCSDERKRPHGQQEAAATSKCAPRSLDVLVFNIEYGGTLVDFGNVVEAIRLSGAEIVAVEEAYGNLERLATELGWPYFDRRTHVLSSLPLASIEGRHKTVLDLVEVSPGCIVAIGNVHLPNAPSGEELRRSGASTDEIVALENRTRMPMLEPMLRDLEELIAAGIPTFLAGDFNAPTHLDEDFPWPTSLAVEAVGLRDTYRETHPDPRERPGFTWWAARPRVEGWNPEPEAPQSRIDFLYAGGPVRITDTRLVGEAGGRDVDLSVEPWVSDHRAVLGSFEVTASPLPPLVAVPHQRVVAGEELVVQVGGSIAGWSLYFVPAGGAVTAARATRKVSGTAALEILEVASAGWTPGAWEVVLADELGTERARAAFWTVERGALPSVAPDRPTYRPGEPVTAIWKNTDGNRWDWAGIYPAAAPSAATSDQDNLLLWRHTGSTVSGQLQLDGASEGEGWPLAPGDYRLVLGLDDSYVVIAEAPFAVLP